MDTRLRSLTRLTAELIGKGRGAPDDVRSLKKEYRFDEARSLRAIVIRKPATLSPVRASPP